MYFLRFCPFLLCSLLALLWFVGLFQSPSQFSFFISSNINRELLNTYSCVLSSLNIKEDVKEQAWLVNDECFCSSACTLLASSALCTLNAAHHKGIEWSHESRWMETGNINPLASSSLCCNEPHFRAALERISFYWLKLLFASELTKLPKEKKSGLIVFPFYAACRLVWHDRFLTTFFFFFFRRTT